MAERLVWQLQPTEWLSENWFYCLERKNETIVARQEEYDFFFVFCLYSENSKNQY